MMAPEKIAAVISLYEKNGWLLRRLITAPENVVEMGKIASARTPPTPLRPGKMDAAWFSRPPSDGPTAWELRALDEAPYALLQFFDESSDELEQQLAEVELRLAENTAGKSNA
jgi:hypothetical protein